MKIAFISGVLFGYYILEEILNQGFDVKVVFSYEDSKKESYSDYISFDKICEKENINHVKVKNINDSSNIEILKNLQPDIILVMGWSQLLNDEIISIPKIGVIGSHPTELPKFRGRAPIPWTILKDLKESALTFFFIEKGIDDGDIIDQEKFLVDENDDASILYKKIVRIGKKMIVRNLKLLEKNIVKRRKQKPSEFIEYWGKRTPENGLINWEKSCVDINRLIRATTHPYPGAFTYYQNKKLKIFKSEKIENGISEPRKIISILPEGVMVGTGSGCIILKTVQYNSDIEKNATKVFSERDIGNLFEKLHKDRKIDDEC